MILSLDIATCTGWCHGKPGARPTYGTLDLRGGKGGTGQVIAVFRGWFDAICQDIRPELVTFESPWLPVGRKGDRFAPNANVSRRLYGMTGAVEAVCWERKIRCLEAAPFEIAKFWLGTAGLKREQKKARTIERCRELGWPVEDDNQADALSLWCMTEEKICPGIRRATVGPLFNVLTPRGLDSRAAPLGGDACPSDQTCLNDRI